MVRVKRTDNILRNIVTFDAPSVAISIKFDRRLGAHAINETVFVNIRRVYMI